MSIVCVGGGEGCWDNTTSTLFAARELFDVFRQGDVENETPGSAQPFSHSLVAGGGGGKPRRSVSKSPRRT